VGQLIIGALKRAGYSPATTFTYTDVTGSQMPNAVLRFRSEGVTYVFDYTAALRQFMVTAEQQGYRPRYSLVSSMGPRDQIAAQVPAAQLRGALGVGFCPTCDVASPQDPGAAPGARSCRQILTRAGLRYEGEPKRTALGVGYFFCDGIRLGAGKLGPDFQPAITFRSGLRPGRRSVTGAVRDFGWTASVGVSVTAVRSRRSPEPPRDRDRGIARCSSTARENISTKHHRPRPLPRRRTGLSRARSP
jgi:hypothetical protein